VLSSSDFIYLAELVKKNAGISLEEGKEYLVISKVEPLAKSLGFESISDLVLHLKKGTDLIKQKQVIESLATHETSFFRDLEPFEVIKSTILPEIIERQRPLKELTIWCGAASSGQEPYSLCMLIRENFPELATWKIHFHATDISSAILETAKSGIFSQFAVNRGLPVRMMAKYFEKTEQGWVIKPEIRQMVTFSELNLLHPFKGLPKSDLIMLRNVLIYFDAETKKKILTKVHDLLKPSGYLFLGNAESTLNLNDAFERISFEKTRCYKKV
jgi:chemotaxis protein methyltransferase CheR